MSEEELTIFIRKVFEELSKEDGFLLYDMLENNHLIIDGKNICGTFRYNADCIAEVVGDGTTYITFYCTKSGSNKRQEFINKIQEAGGKIL